MVPPLEEFFGRTYSAVPLSLMRVAISTVKKCRSLAGDLNDSVEEKPVKGQRGTMPRSLYERIFPLEILSRCDGGVYEAPKE
jgi:hypothetical protein